MEVAIVIFTACFSFKFYAIPMCFNTYSDIELKFSDYLSIIYYLFIIYYLLLLFIYYLLFITLLKVLCIFAFLFLVEELFFYISYKAGLVLLNSLRFYVSGKAFISLSYLNFNCRIEYSWLTVFIFLYFENFIPLLPGLQDFS